MKFKNLFLYCFTIEVLCFTGCTDDNTEHVGAFDAFGKTITVKGASTLSADHFNSSKKKIKMAFIDLDLSNPSSPARDPYTAMVNLSGFEIVIQAGNASHDGCKRVGNTMAFHVVWLIQNNSDNIKNDIDANKNLFND